jgi:hypothetical protein
MNKEISSKALHVFSMFDSLKIDQKLLLVTSLGIITGKPIDLSNEEDKNYSDIWKNTNEKADALKSKYSKVRSDGARIFLKDVELLVGNNSKVNIPYLIIFTDQILGMSISE